MPTSRFPRAAILASLTVLLASIVAPAFGQTPPPVSFIASADYVVGSSSIDLATGDFRTDGNLDFVTLTGSGEISVLLGKGDGTFQPAVSYPVAPNSIMIRLGDFNGDGKLDILVANESNTAVAIVSVSVLLGNGDGTFQPQKVTNVANSNCRCLAVGAFNGGGKLDLLIPVSVPQQGDSALNVMVGNGDGTFQAAGVASPGPVPTPLQLNVADFNGDGKPDLVSGNVGSSNPGFQVFLGNGDGTFQQPVTTPEPAGFGKAFVVADFNGDGRPDLAFVTTVSVLVLLGNGDATFQSPISTNNVFVEFIPMSSADVNGDGTEDMLAVGDVSGSVVVLLGNGDGTFKTAALLTNLPGAGLVPGDFNKDGKIDIASYSDASPGVVSVALGNGDGTYQIDSFLQVGLFDTIIPQDVTGDGIVDLLASSSGRSGSTIGVIPGNGNGSFQALIETFVNSACGVVLSGHPPCVTAAGDLNADGKLDVVATSTNSYTNSVGVFLGKGDGTFASEVDYSGGGGSIALGDFTGNGALDIVTGGGSTNGVSILLGNGDGTFGFPSTIPIGAPANFVAVGDFNNDGNPDLAVATGSGVAILLGNGDGTFGAPSDYPVPGCVFIAVGDLRGKGKLDIATANSTFNNVSVLLGNGDGTFGSATNYPVLATATSVAIGDLNGDGKADLAALTGPTLFVAHYHVSVLAGNGDGTFQPAANFGTSGQGALTIADLNGDGSPDIAVGGISLLFNRNPAGSVAQLTPGFVGFGSVAVASAPTKTVTLSNPGNAVLSISSIALTGPQSSDFKQTNTCGTAVVPGSSCTFTLTFTPSALGLRTASIHITDNAFGTPQVLNLGGTGVVAAPSAALAPGSVSFGNQVMGVPSASQGVTLTNSGNAALTISGITLTGGQASDFQQTNTCGSSVAAGGKCTISVTFTPAATGPRSGAVSITDNAATSPQAVALSGTGTSDSLGFGIATGSSSSATVAAGNPASYILSIGGQGIGGTATLSCTGAPKGADCSVPSTVAVSATTASTFTVNVTTTSRTMAAVIPDGSGPSRWLWVAVIVSVAVLPTVHIRNRSPRWVRTAPVMLLLFFCSCGGGGSAGPKPNPNPNGTPSGTYRISVTATVGSMSQSTSLTLTVQ